MATPSLAWHLDRRDSQPIVAGDHRPEIQQQISLEETWLTTNTPATAEYQEILEELIALQAYVAELRSQATSLDDVLLELTLVQASRCKPDLLFEYTQPL